MRYVIENMAFLTILGGTLLKRLFVLIFRCIVTSLTTSDTNSRKGKTSIKNKDSEKVTFHCPI